MAIILEKYYFSDKYDISVPTLLHSYSNFIKTTSRKYEDSAVKVNWIKEYRLGFETPELKFLVKSGS